MIHIKRCKVIHRHYPNGPATLVSISIVDSETVETACLFSRIYEGYPDILLVPVTKQAAYDMARESGYEHVDNFDTNTEEEEPVAQEESFASTEAR
ncbi:hypothetical protein [Terribacillus saccharophilus]|uniref:hypothetical protein n=1 Tax=Terribacillus saccharophilus TaxID=361277 RepID=UPI003981BDB3